MIDGVRLWPDQSYLVTNATFFNNVAYLIEIPIYHPPGGTPLHRLIEIIAPTNSWLQFTYPPDGRPNYPWPDWQDWYGPGAPGYASFIEPNINQDGVYSADRWLWRSVSTNENAVATNVVYNVTPYTP
jgi:hypothetical protein